MILFIFEGHKREIKFFNVLKRLYWGEEETVVSVFDCNIDALYHAMIKLGDGADIVEFMMDKYNGSADNPFEGITRSDSFSEIYLLFDYDFHDMSRSAETLNCQLRYLLEFFNDETGNGKLYVNYPMVEAITYTKELPDSEYDSYSVTRDECCRFKQLAGSFCAYPNYDFLLRESNDILLRNWAFIRRQNIAKARWMTNLPSPNQLDILNAQISKYECLKGCRVSILSALALLLYDWLGQ